MLHWDTGTGHCVIILPFGICDSLLDRNHATLGGGVGLWTNVSFVSYDSPMGVKAICLEAFPLIRGLAEVRLMNKVVNFVKSIVMGVAGIVVGRGDVKVGEVRSD